MRSEAQKVGIYLLAIVGMAFVSTDVPATPFLSEPFENIYQYRFSDGVGIKVHYSEKTLKDYGADADLGSQVLSAAVAAYRTITRSEGFNSPGYSFADPDKKYAYDPDKTIDIYLGDPAGENTYPELGHRNRMFRDAPCFDVIPISQTQYQAVILLPANYREFIKSWEKINPSPMGRRHVRVDLRGTLMHEMLHVVLFYYNKNLNKSEEPARTGKARDGAAAKNLDWYVEGLARYFETFAGAKHDFYSQGFKQTFVDKIRFSRGGSNYFMRYPDQPFTRLRYENALFWRFMDYRYGMRAIERLSRIFRKENADFKQALQEVTGEPFEDLLKTFAVSSLQKDFGLRGDTGYLNEIARTRLRFRDGVFYLLDGNGNEKLLGRTCATDWIGRWENIRAGFGSPSVAGDGTEAADVSPWATDFFEISPDDAPPALPKFELRHAGEGSALYLQALFILRDGSVLKREWGALEKRHSQSVDLPAFLRESGLTAGDVDRTCLLITNADPRETALYAIRLIDP